MKNTKINYVICAINSLVGFLSLFVFFELFFKRGADDNSIFGDIIFPTLFLLFSIIILLVELQGTIRKKFRYLYFEGMFLIIFGGFMLLGVIISIFNDKIVLDGLLSSGIISLYFIITGIYRYKMYNKEEYTIHI